MTTFVLHDIGYVSKPWFEHTRSLLMHVTSAEEEPLKSCKPPLQKLLFPYLSRKCLDDDNPHIKMCLFFELEMMETSMSVVNTLRDGVVRGTYTDFTSMTGRAKRSVFAYLCLARRCALCFTFVYNKYGQYGLTVIIFGVRRADAVVKPLAFTLQHLRKCRNSSSK